MTKFWAEVKTLGVFLGYAALVVINIAAAVDAARSGGLL